MPALTNYVIITDNPVALPAGNVAVLPFDAPAVDATIRSILLFRIFPTLNAGLELAINGAVIFTVAAFNEEGGRSLHEVVPDSLVLITGNNLTMTNIGAADVNVSDAVLLFQT
jgi:hypothetical protein